MNNKNRTQGSTTPRRWAGLWALAGVVASLGGCASEWDSGAYMPANFTSAGFVEITSCEKSGGHGGKYVNTWVSAAAHEAWKAGTLPFAVDTVFVKEGFDDAKCTERSSYWAMKKLPAGSGGKAGDWSWQQLDADGVVESEGQVGGCTGCHSGYAANDSVGTKAP